ncbi:pre-mRNA cleavage complex 2 protein Pcf11 [Caerostris extrusa]|uniref:Pre-mRNA cleavage complex 2 protein Pcf11 n=1 Tax=Caerostris extrusa TaxID=172846 RepID=A0AAV4RFK7_CAEEX|nr:pre-mRNA cleavage complex 2 protein Pcf11 [Caerostris extrusa]
MSEAVAEEYRSSLHDLNFNSKPHINMLTMLAEDNQKFAPLIVDTIVKHIHSVQPDLKLPSLYLVDSIMKNIGGQYITLFCKCIVTVFTTVFSKVEEATRSSLFKLRQTWNEILSKQILYEIDCKVHNIDPAWPITATPPVAKVAPTKTTIHINPKFVGGTVAQAPHPLGNQGKSMALKKTEEIPKNTEPEMSLLKNPDKMLKMIEEKKRELNALTQKKLEMAAEQRKKTMRANVIPQQNIEKKNENHRDPRLKKNVLIHQTAAETSKNSLQSVVVVPKTPSDVIINQTFDEVSKLNSKKCSPKNELLNQGFPNETFHSSIKDQEIKGVKNINKNKNFKENNMQKHFTDNDNSTNKNAKFLNKKHPLSPEKNTVPSKMPCKEFGNKMNRPTTHTKRLPQSQIETPIAKKARFENTKSNNKSNAQLNVSSYGGNDPLTRVKNEEMSGKIFPSIQKSEESLPIGNKDTDYRIQWPQQNTDYRHQVKNKQWPPQGPESRLYPQNGNLNDIEPRYPAIKMESSLKIKTEKVDDLDKMQNVCNLDVSQIKRSFRPNVWSK